MVGAPQIADREDVSGVLDARRALPFQRQLLEGHRVFLPRGSDADIEAFDAHVLDQRRAVRLVREVEPDDALAVTAANLHVFQPADVIRVVFEAFGSGVALSRVDRQVVNRNRDGTAVDGLVRAGGPFVLLARQTGRGSPAVAKADALVRSLITVLSGPAPCTVK